MDERLDNLVLRSRFALVDPEESMKSSWASYRVGQAWTLCLASLASAGFLAFLSGCAGTEIPPAPRDAASSDYEYIIGPLDTVNIIVWRNPELSMTVPVRPDGKVTTPLVDDLPALGKTPTAARAGHREGARQVHPRSGRHRRRHRPSSDRASEQIRVIGEAAKPQILPFRKNMTLLDVMIAVGGLTDFADGNKATHLPRRRRRQVLQRARCRTWSSAATSRPTSTCGPATS